MTIRLHPESATLPRVLSRAVMCASLLMLSACGGGTSDSGDGAGDSQSSTARTNPATKPRGEGDAVLQRALSADDVPTVAAASMEAPPLEVVPSVLDFGFVPPNQDVDGEVELHNRGDKPLLILAAEPSCKCTTLEDIGGTMIEPGGKAVLKARLDGAAMPGEKTASIKVLVDGYAVVKTIDLRAQISLPIRVSPQIINAVRGQNRQGRLVVQSNDSRIFSICAVHGEEPEFLGFDPATDPPTNQYVVLYDLDRMAEPFPRQFVIETDQEDVPMVDLFLRHESTYPRINRNLKLQGGYRFPLGRIAPGTPATIEIPFDSLARPLAAIISLAPEATARLRSTRTEETSDGVITHALVEVTPKSDQRGLMYIPLEAMTDNGETAQFHVYGSVVPDGEACAGPKGEPVAD